MVRVLRPGGRIAVTVPRYGPEKICWALSDAYHEVEGGHIRIYSGDELLGRMRGGRPRAVRHAPRARRCTRRTGGSSAPSASDNDEDPLVTGVPQAAGLGHHEEARWPPGSPSRRSNPLIGKSFVPYRASPEAARVSAGRRRSPGLLTAEQAAATAASLAAQQEPTGRSPGSGGPTRPLGPHRGRDGAGRGGEHEAAARAYDWCLATSTPDGSWPTTVARRGRRGRQRRDQLLRLPGRRRLAPLPVHRRRAFLDRCGRRCAAAVEFVLGLQQPGGHRLEAGGGRPRSRDALLTGCSSIYQALRAALALAEHREEPQPDWELAAGRLGHAMRRHPERFLDKRTYSMDWYYPVLGGAVRGDAGARAGSRRAGTTSSCPGSGCAASAPTRGSPAARAANWPWLWSDGGARPGAADPARHAAPARPTDGVYWTGYVFDDEAVWPRRADDLHRRRGDPRRRRAVGDHPRLRHVPRQHACRWHCPRSGCECGCAEHAEQWVS